MEELLRYLEETRGPIGYAIIFASSLIEYVVPPFPGDTIALLGVVLSASAGYSAALVFLALTAGSTTGGAAAWGFGRWLRAREHAWPRWLRGPRAVAALQVIEDGYRRHGAAYLAVNRFLPALRSFFFVGAGLAGMRLGAVILWGAASAALWNALILGVGFAVGAHWDALRGLFGRYSVVAGAALGLGVIAFVWRVRQAVRRGPLVPGAKRDDPMNPGDDVRES